MRWLLALLLADCVGVDLINQRWDESGRSGTVTYRGVNLRADIIAERRERALRQAAVYCGGGYVIVGEHLEGFNEHFVDFRCETHDGG